MNAKIELLILALQGTAEILTGCLDPEGMSDEATNEMQIPGMEKDSPCVLFLTPDVANGGGIGRQQSSGD